MDTLGYFYFLYLELSLSSFLLVTSKVEIERVNCINTDQQIFYTYFVEFMDYSIISLSIFITVCFLSASYYKRFAVGTYHANLDQSSLGTPSQ